MTDTSLLITSYATLQTAMAKWLNRSDLAQLLPVFIQGCESRLRRVVKTKHQALISTTLVIGDGSVSLPADLISVTSVSVNSPALWQGELEPTSYANVLDERRKHQTAGPPKLYAIVNEAIYFAPLSDGTYGITAQVEGPFVPLSDTNTTNWILDDYPDVYLYGALAESAPYLRDDERVGLWDGRYKVAMTELEVAAERSQWPAAPTMEMPRNFLGDQYLVR